MSHPLLQRLIEQGIPLLDEASFEAHVQAQPFSVLFFSEDPKRFPESLDVAVILPELLQAFPQLSAALMTRGLEPRLQGRYGFSQWPTLVFLKDGQFLGSLSRTQNWGDYMAQIPQILARTPQIPLLSLEGTATACQTTEPQA